MGLPKDAELWIRTADYISARTRWILFNDYRLTNPGNDPVAQACVESVELTLRAQRMLEEYINNHDYDLGVMMMSIHEIWTYNSPVQLIQGEMFYV